MEYAAFINKLKKAFEKELPGFNSQIKAAPKLRENLQDTDAIKNAKKSAVLILLYPQNSSVYIPFIRRITNGGMHSGQIAFPGGKFEYHDIDLNHTAVRETEEEVGVCSKDISILKKLTPLYIPVSNYLVMPFVGKIDYKPDFIANKEEVDEIFEVNIRELVKPALIDKEFFIRNTKINAPFFVLKDIEIWGATAMILSEFVDILKHVEFN
jgi:8-oxo-dGTP pyrophosphatase MutT (NUDIX family)